MHNKKCTLVTAYYDFNKKKHSSNKYYEWIQNFLPYLDTYVVIFTDVVSYDKLYSLRKNHLDKTKIIILPIEEFYTFKYMKHWEKDLARDHETYHSIDLYMIWNEKSMFVKRAIDLNPFDTDYYCWSDIGMIRDKNLSQYIKHYPSVRNDIEDNRIYLLNIYHTFTEYDSRFDGLATELFRYRNAIGGGVIFGHKIVFEKWITTYYKTLQEFVNKDLFAGKDQSVMACVYVKNRDMIKLISPQESPFNNDWFYLVFYFC